MRAHVAFALVAAALGIAAQFGSLALVHQGDPVRMLRLGEAYAVRADLTDAERNAAVAIDGFDGQFSFYLARDPLLGPTTIAALDAPRLRARRIGLPLAGALPGLVVGPAWGLVIAETLSLLMVLALVQRAAWRAALPPAWCLTIPLLLPFALAIEFVTAEVLVAALVTAGLAFRHRPAVAVACLGLAGLSKEVAALAPIAFWLADASAGRRTAGLRWLLALAPLAVWELTLALRLEAPDQQWRLLANLALPGQGLWKPPLTIWDRSPAASGR